MLADEEGQLAALPQLEMAGALQALPQMVEGCSRRRGLVGGGRELLHPSGRSGEDEPAAGIHQTGQTLEKTGGCGEAAEEIRRMDEVESPQIVPQGHGIARLETHSAGPGFHRLAMEANLLRPMALRLAEAGEVLSLAQGLGGFDEAPGVVDADDFLREAGKLETGPTDGATDIQHPGEPRPGREGEMRADDPGGGGGKAEHFTRQGWQGGSGEDVGLRTEVEQQILVQEPVLFVEGKGGHGVKGIREAAKLEAKTRMVSAPRPRFLGISNFEFRASRFY